MKYFLRPNNLGGNKCGFHIGLGILLGENEKVTTSWNELDQPTDTQKNTFAKNDGADYMYVEATGTPPYHACYFNVADAYKNGTTTDDVTIPANAYEVDAVTVTKEDGSPVNVTAPAGSATGYTFIIWTC